MAGIVSRLAWAMTVALAVVAVGPVLGREDDPDEGQTPKKEAPAYRDGFEAGRTSWREEETDATVKLFDHDRSDRAAHDGERSERLRFEAAAGSALYYSYALPKVPLTNDLQASLFVRSDHAGLQLYGKVILPADTDPDTGHPSFVMVPGAAYDATDRWQRLSLSDIRELVEQQARVLRAKSKRPVSLEGAYLDQLVMNLYGGPGETVVYLDDLSVSPVPQEALAQPEPPSPSTPPPIPGPAPVAGLPEPKVAPDTRAANHIRFVRNRLYKDGYGWVFSAIHAPGADLALLRRHGFDVLALDAEADANLAIEAARQGFFLMPTLTGRNSQAPTEPEELVAAAAAFPARESVAFWNLGEDLGSSTNLTIREAERDRIRALVAGLRHSDESVSHLTTGGVAGLFADYARVPQNLDLIGVHPLGWGACQEILDYERFLAQRRDLTVRNPEALFWTMIRATPPEEVHQAVWGFEAPPAWGIARMQPEQLRLYTYAALAAGYRGIGFRADAELTRATGRPLLIEMAFLNAEIDLLETIIAEGFDPIPLLPTFPPDPPIIITYTSPGMGMGNSSQTSVSVRSVKAESKNRPEPPALPTTRAAAIATKDRHTRLLLLADFANAAQWQPSQMAVNDLKIRVPGAAESAQAYEISLGGVRVLDTSERQRVAGGLQLSLKHFAVTSILLITTDGALVERINAAVSGVRSLAIPLAIEQAQLQFQWVSEINSHLADLRHSVKNSADLLREAENDIKAAQEALENEDYPTAWARARHAGQPLRMVMFDHYAKALQALVKAAVPAEERNAPEPPKEPVFTRTKRPKVERPKTPLRIVTPTSCPPLLAFNTLPQHYRWVGWIENAQFGKNMLPSGSFDDAEALTSEGWRTESYPTDGISGTISSVEGGATPSSKRALKLAVAPAPGRSVDSLPPYLDYPAAAIRTPAVQVGPRELVRISVKVKMPRVIPAGGGGLIVRDSLGGEPLQFRTTNPLPEWSEIILFRRAPADGPLIVTLGLAGIAEAYFDDLQIQRMESTGSPESPEPNPSPRQELASPPQGRPRRPPASVTRSPATRSQPR